MTRKTGVWACVVAVAVLCSCTAPAAAPSASTSVPPSPSAGTSASAAIVGLWRGTHECEGIVRALTEAGFDERVVIENVVGNGLVSGVDQPDDVADVDSLCRDARPLEHSHEFTADGQFFSYDQHGAQVDSGAYEQLDDDTVVIGDVTFDFRIEGDHLTLEPQLPEECREFECQWAVMVAMPWSGLERAP
jgi:hypothetical protein